MSVPVPQKSIGQRVWTAVRFLLFGWVGFYAWLIASVEFIGHVFEGDEHVMTWFYWLPLAFTGMLMTLYGFGEWGHWGYSLVFLSIPVTFLTGGFGTVILVPDRWKVADLFGITGVTALLTLAGVRIFYERRAKRQTEIQSDDHDAV